MISEPSGSQSMRDAERAPFRRARSDSERRFADHFAVAAGRLICLEFAGSTAQFSSSAPDWTWSLRDGPVPQGLLQHGPARFHRGARAKSRTGPSSRTGSAVPAAWNCGQPVLIGSSLNVSTVIAADF